MYNMYIIYISSITADKKPFYTQAVPLARYVLANGTTPATGYVWTSMPYASSDPGALVFCGADSARFCKEGCHPPFTSGCVGDGIGTNLSHPSLPIPVGFCAPNDSN